MLEVNISYHFKLYSHPDRLLKDHIIGVHKKAVEKLNKIVYDFSIVSKNDLQKILEVAALFHDFGKATSFFQNYLKNPEQEANETERARRRHGLISAIMTYGILNEIFPEREDLCFLGFIIVRRHHGNLENFRNLLVISNNNLDNCKIQAENINYEEYQQIIKLRELTLDLNKKFLDKIFLKFQSPELRQLRRMNRSFTAEHYFVLNLLYSILLSADKTDAIFGDETISLPEMLKSIHVKNYKEGFKNRPDNTIDNIRNTAFNSVERNISKLKEDERIFSINIPTGSGKTINSLNAALKIAEKFGHDHVIYCLPFTSVIDQNYSVFDDIRAKAGFESDSGILLKHHHLTDINYQSKTSEKASQNNEENILKEYTPNEALYLIEGWESRLTVTTFVQFMCSLISYKNASLRKFHRLSNAVIILDEVQSIPHHFWKLVREMIMNVATMLNTRIILVTATMPLIFSEQDCEIKELVQGKENMFLSLSRIELDVSHMQDGAIDWNSFCEASTELLNENPEKDILFIMNTIKSARELYNILIDFKTTHDMVYLSSHIIPKRRLQLIKKIKNKNREKPLLIVSTQLVEAGVDIDLDIVVRDFAPLDSIFQASGRCNRESRNRVKGRVILYYIKDSNGWTPSDIYNNFLRQKTMKVLKNKKIIREEEFYNLAHIYFDEVHQFGSQRDSEIVLKRISGLKYYDGDGKISIDLVNSDYTHSVFIENDEQAIRAWDTYIAAMEMKKGYEKNASIKQARRKIAEFIINIPDRCFESYNDEGIYYLKNEVIEDYYDYVLGFDVKKLLLNKSCEIF